MTIPTRIKDQLLRATHMAAPGVRLEPTRDDGVYELTIGPVEGLEADDLRVRIGSRGTAPSVSEVADRASLLHELASLAQKRADAVRDAGGEVDNAPAWAFLGHPVMRGVLATVIDDPTAFLPLDPGHWMAVGMTPTRHGMRIGYNGIRLKRGSGQLRIDAASQIARIVLPGEFPESVVTTLKGRPLHEVLDLPGISRGEAAGDSPVLDGWVRNGRLHITVECQLVPLADAPTGIDNTWLRNWASRHYR